MARKCKHGRTKSGKCRKATKRGCKCATRDLCVRKLRFVSRMKKGQYAAKQRKAAASVDRLYHL